jgi:hypothetical protein
MGQHKLPLEVRKAAEYVGKHNPGHSAMRSSLMGQNILSSEQARKYDTQMKHARKPLINK